MLPDICLCAPWLDVPAAEQCTAWFIKPTAKGRHPGESPSDGPQQARVACATGELVDNPAMHHSVEQEALAYAMLPLPCDRLGTGEETIYFTTDCALIHGYQLHPWIASCPGNGPGIRPMMPRGQWVQRQAMRMANRRSHSDLSPGCSRPPQQAQGYEAGTVAAEYPQGTGRLY